MFVRTVPLDRKCRTQQKRVQMDKKMKILNDKMSQQSRRALPPPHSFFCCSTCSTWQVLRTALLSLWFMNNWHLLPQFTAPLVSARLTIYYDSYLYFFLVPSFLFFCSVISSPSIPYSKICSWGVLPIPYFITFVHSLSYLHSFSLLSFFVFLSFIYLFLPFLFFVHCTRPFFHNLHLPFFTSSFHFVALPTQSLFISLFLTI